MESIVSSSTIVLFLRCDTIREMGKEIDPCFSYFSIEASCECMIIELLIYSLGILNSIPTDVRTMDSSDDLDDLLFTQILGILPTEIDIDCTLDSIESIAHIDRVEVFPQ